MATATSNSSTKSIAIGNSSAHADVTPSAIYTRAKAEAESGDTTDYTSNVPNVRDGKANVNAIAVLDDANSWTAKLWSRVRNTLVAEGKNQNGTEVTYKALPQTSGGTILERCAG